MDTGLDPAFYLGIRTNVLMYIQPVRPLALQTFLMAILIRWPSLCINVSPINWQMHQWNNASTRSFIIASVS